MPKKKKFKPLQQRIRLSKICMEEFYEMARKADYRGTLLYHIPGNPLSDLGRKTFLDLVAMGISKLLPQKSKEALELYAHELDEEQQKYWASMEGKINEA